MLFISLFQVPRANFLGTDLFPEKARTLQRQSLLLK